MTCQRCREQYDESDDAPPCDVGGLDACPYWRTHGMSPGALTLSNAAALALEVHYRTHLVGWEPTRLLMHLDLTPSQADDLLDALVFLGEDQRQREQEAHNANLGQ